MPLPLLERLTGWGRSSTVWVGFLATSGTLLTFSLSVYKAHSSFQVSSVKMSVAYSLGTAEP